MLARHAFTAVACLVLWSVCATALAAPEPVVIGQSLPLTGPGFPVANRVLAGARAQVERVNANGGIHGRPLELVTLDDGGDPQRVAANLRTLVRQRGAVAIANCLGERACLEAAQVTRELRVPLVGPMSGALQLRTADVQHVFSTRPDDTREADALARQLQSIGISRVVVLSDDSEPARTDALVAALQRAGQQVARSHTDGREASLTVALQDLAKSAPQAVVISLGYAALDALDRLPPGARAGVPLTVATLSSAGLTQLTRLFRDRMIGYTSVVPNLDVTRLSIVRDLQRDADAFIGPEAATFEGLEAYINLRLCTEALRRTGPRADGQRLSEALESLGTLDLGGFRLVFGRDRHHGSDYVEIGMRARDGRMLR
ncbi:MAG: ABC transporter substrate-binding protein [Pseudomonadota bacterium]